MTNEEIRVRCAEIVGWTISPFMKEHCKVPYGWHPQHHPKKTNFYEFPIPQFDADANAALTLCDWMAEKGYPIVFSFMGSKWVCVFYSSKEIDCDELANESAETLPLAICRAFLAANQA